MKCRTYREYSGDLIAAVVTTSVYATVLAANDLYGWTKSAEKLGAAVAEIINGYCAESGRDMVADIEKELRGRGFDKFVIEMKKGK